MDARQQEALIQRLISNPHDQAAIAEAHAGGQSDPEAYATILEKVGLGTPEPALASHWLNEAANVWITTFNDAHRAANTLLLAVERDPGADKPAERLLEMYRGAGDDHRPLVTLHERRAEALIAQAARDPGFLHKAGALYREVARLCSEGAHADPLHARQALIKAVELDPSDQLAIYTLREALKAAGEWTQALRYFEPEQQLESDPGRKLALFLDQAEVAKQVGDKAAAARALLAAMPLDAGNDTLKAQAATAVLEAYREGLGPTAEQLAQASRAFVELAEAYPGEHGMLYSMCASELTPADDRAIQLAMYYAEQLGRLGEVAGLAAGYVAENPQGVLVAQASAVAGDVAAPPKPVARPASAGAVAGGAVPGASAPPEESLDDLLEKADSLAKKSRKNEAIATYKQVLQLEPTNSDALGYLLEQLPLKRKYGELQDVLLSAVAAPEAADEDRVRWLREVAGLCENQLRDLDGAVAAWQRLLNIDPTAEGVQDQLRRLLMEARRWDDLADLLSDEAERTEDLEVRIALLKELAKLHLAQRGDEVAAGEAWAMIASLSTGDDDALFEAVKLFEQAERFDRAAEVIAANVGQLDDRFAQTDLYFKLGEVRAALGDVVAAAEALSEGASTLKDPTMWAKAEEYFVQLSAWEQAANAADEQAALAQGDHEHAELLAQAAEYFAKAGETDEAVTRLEHAVELAPTNETYAKALEKLLVGAERVEELTQLFLARADKLQDKEARVSLRKRAAKVQAEYLGEVSAARASYVLVLQDQEDPEALRWLADEAEQRTDHEAAVHYLERLERGSSDQADKVETVLREAKLRVSGLSDPEGAIQRYHYILARLDADEVRAMREIADLEEGRGNHAEAATMLERLFQVSQEPEAKLEYASRLADLYEGKLQQPLEAMRTLTYVHEADPDDFDATQRLCDLAEANERWAVVAQLMVELIAVEGDDEEVSRMTQRLARIHHEELGQGAEALAVLGYLADDGDEPCRRAFVELGDRLGEQAQVAQRLLGWYREAAPSQARTDALHAAFKRFVDASEPGQAIDVAKELAKSRAARSEIAETLEALALQASDLDALTIAHALRVAESTGDERAGEYVRQAEVLTGCGVAAAEAILHGEQALTSVSPENVEPLLARLSLLTSDATSKIDIYERQISRCKDAESRVRALCRAAEVAAGSDDFERAQGFFQLALTGAIADDDLERIVELVRGADAERVGGSSLRAVLAESLANGGQGARDGGKTRSRMLRRAARLAHEELGETQRALKWLGDALSQHVEPETLQALEDVSAALGDYQASERVVTQALEQVFDGPMVRQLLSYRAQLRQERLSDNLGAAADLKQLHDLNPSDMEVNTRLARLYEELGDHRGMIQLYEDQILRSRDQEHRAELARKVARMWQEHQDDHRETADAWRRVLRLCPGDDEAKAGLAQAKEAMLKDKGRTSGSSWRAAARTSPPTPHAEKQPASAEDDASEEDAASDRAASGNDAFQSEFGGAEESDEPVEAGLAGAAETDDRAADAVVAAEGNPENQAEDTGVQEAVDPQSEEVAEQFSADDGVGDDEPLTSDAENTPPRHAFDDTSASTLVEPASKQEEREPAFAGFQDPAEYVSADAADTKPGDETDDTESSAAVDADLEGDETQAAAALAETDETVAEDAAQESEPAQTEAFAEPAVADSEPAVTDEDPRSADSVHAPESYPSSNGAEPAALTDAVLQAPQGEEDVVLPAEHQEPSGIGIDVELDAVEFESGTAAGTPRPPPPPSRRAGVSMPPSGRPPVPPPRATGRRPPPPPRRPSALPKNDE